MDAEKAEELEDESRYRFVSREEILEHVSEDDVVIDIGSGTGFFTDDIADVVEKVYAVDFQEQMHRHYRDKGVPENVELLQGKASEIEIQADIIVSIFSFHEIEQEKALETFSRVLEDGGKLLMFDWSSRGSAECGPPPEKRLNAESAAKKIGGFFEVEEAVERRDTFKVVASVK